MTCAKQLDLGEAVVFHLDQYTYNRKHEKSEEEQIPRDSSIDNKLLSARMQLGGWQKILISDEQSWDKDSIIGML
jgi:hypothetical protein